MTLANKITIGRILLVPFIIIGLLENQKMWVYSLLIICMATDFLDGLMARRRNEHTKLGAFLDPMADKLLLISVFMTLAFLRLVPMWVFVAVFSRDLLIVLGWVVIYILTNSSDIDPRPLGKYTTALQMLTALAAIMELSAPYMQGLVWAMVALTIISSVDYVLVGEKKLGGWG